MKLYYYPRACSLSPHIVLRESGLPFEMQRVDIYKKRVDDGREFAEINEKELVPVLELDDGQRLTEGPVIVQYVADRVPGSGLAPELGTMERYRLQEWLNFLTSDVHKQFGPLWQKNAPEEWKQVNRGNLARRFDWLTKRLDGNSYLMREQFTVADAYLFTLLNWCQWVGPSLERWPTLGAYVDRVAARPKVREALKVEGLIN